MIPADVLFIINTFEAAGYQAYAVGGCVRDTMLKKRPSDWDITTNCLPEKTVELFSSYKMVLNGMKHGTVSVIMHGKMYEITTFRIDGEYADMRRPKDVTFTSELNADLARRDFTVNAMAMDKHGNITDIFGGQHDLECRLIRCVGDPKKRFGEDALRIMRGLRFASYPGFTLDAKTLRYANRLAGNLSGIAYERIYTELKKMLAQPDAYKVMLKTYPVFKAIFPTLTVSREDWKAVCSHIRNANRDLELCLASILFHADLEAELMRLKAESTVKKHLRKLYELNLREIKNYRVFLRMLMCEYDRDSVLMLCRYRVLSGAAPYSLLTNAQKAAAGCCGIKELAITGRELYASGLRNRKIKDALQYLLEAVVEERCLNEKAALLFEARKLKGRRHAKSAKTQCDA